MSTTVLLERRFAGEWELLKQLTACNPGRITHVQADHAALSLHLHGPEAVAAGASFGPERIHLHRVRVDYPVHFPAVPMELFLAIPILHPNVHPETGFVCLWERHRVSNTVEHALHKLTAMLAGELRNTSPLHVMQPAAIEHAWHTTPMPLVGVAYDPGPSAFMPGPGTRRRRLQ